jgi:hypothetical protein
MRFLRLLQRGPTSTLTLVPAYQARVSLVSSEKAPIGKVLSPTSGPTQVGTTPSLSFRAVVGLDGKLEVDVKL